MQMVIKFVKPSITALQSSGKSIKIWSIQDGGVKIFSFGRLHEVLIWLKNKKYTVYSFEVWNSVFPRRLNQSFKMYTFRNEKFVDWLIDWMDRVLRRIGDVSTM